MEGATITFVLFADGKAEAVSAKRGEHAKALRVACRGGPLYWVAVKNGNKARLPEVSVHFGDHEVFSGFVDGKWSGGWGGWSTRYGLPFEVTEEALVKWKTGDGNRHQQLVPIPPLPDDLDGYCIFFWIQEKEPIAVQVVKHQDLLDGKHPDLRPGIPGLKAPL